MTNLQRFDHNGIELIIDTNTGESYASISGYARLSGKAKSTISERFGEIELKTAQIETTTGIKTVRLISEDLIVEWLPKDNSEMTSNLLRLGVRVFLHELAGYQVSSTATKKEPDGREMQELINFAIDAIFKNVPIKPELVAGLKLNALQNACPAIAPHIEESRQLLINSTATESPLVTVTELGKSLGLSAQKVNQLLIEKGLQTKNQNKKSKKDLTYVPTDRGSEFASVVLSSGKKNDPNSYQQLRWDKQIVALF